ncbi:MAG TPA: hypothetical protein VKU92_08990 [Acidimicrobiales bacterium]|nr:hypothetical protein [Acidimicrobiales bacterium]
MTTVMPAHRTDDPAQGPPLEAAVPRSPSLGEAGRGPAPARDEPPSGEAWPGETGRLTVVPWPDPVIDEIGHDPRSIYAETFWLPVLGPSTTWLLRRFASHLDDAPNGVELEVDDLARRLGIGERSGPNGPFARTVKRCVDFQMARWQGPVLAVRRRLPPLARRHLRRLPETLQAEHVSLLEQLGAPVQLSGRLRAHAERLALSLLEFGDDQAAAEAQLVKWGISPALAAGAASYAGLEHARREEAARRAHPAPVAGRRVASR